MSELTPRRKAAILCVALGPEGAAKVFKHLPDDVVEKLTVEMVRTHDIPPEQAEEVQREAIESAIARGYIAQGGIRYAREVLTRAVGAQRASEILERLATYIEATPFEFLRLTPPDQIYAFLRGEHPQTTALVIANLPTHDLAAKVMALMPPEEQADIALRIGLMTQTQPDVVKEVARVMQTKLDVVMQAEYSAAGGVGSLADILNKSDRATERNILTHLGESHPDLAEEVRSLLFVFEDLLKLDDRTIQLVLKEVDSKDLALALRGASDDVKERILANMSQRAAETLREEMELMPPQRRRAVEEAQTRVVAVVRRLEDDGAIFIARGAESADEELVL
ncbi:MAG TPA: flagellar motor switch protein FliG [Gaiellaceae bacterium]|nr:flagellar motor switch protein FliG [Gaiellaceae bacterium]